MPIYVDSWPVAINDDNGGVIDHPTKEQLDAAGIIVGRDPAIIQQINDLRSNYKSITAQFCTLANIPVVPVLDAITIKTILDNNNNNQLTSLALQLEHLTNDLKQLDGTNALNNIF